MKMSNFYIPTLKEPPADAPLISQQLMLRAGLIRKLASGLYTWLPLGLRILKKMEQIIREEMAKIGAQEILMPAIQPSELWQETDRWEKYGPTLLKMQDRQQRQFCFGPTHEEVITDLLRNELKSYKQLPMCFYQIQMKFRDEIRPRFGVMRAREFLMKDAYSFHLDSDCLENTYKQMHAAYTNILNRLSLKFRAVLADTGSIGGSKSQEFQILAAAGEDEIAYNTQGDYAANIELATSGPLTVNRQKPSQVLKLVETPNITKVEEQAKFLEISTRDILKTLLVQGAIEEYPVVALLLRGDHQINPTKAAKHPLVAEPFTLVPTETVQEISGCKPGFVGPKNLAVPLIADHAVIDLVDFSCGANADDKHYIGFNWQIDCKLPEQTADLRNVVTGDPAPDGKGTLAITRGIEVGHIFQLGNKYSKAMNLTVLNQQGKSTTPLMGCYGLGVSRIIAAAIEQLHDQHGINWPTALAPFQVVIIPIGLHKSDIVKTQALDLYQELQSKNIEVLLEDRKERPGVLFKDLSLIGIPHWIIISDKTLENRQVEYKNRKTSATKLINITEIFKEINQLKTV